MGGTVNDSYWNKDTTGQLTSVGSDDANGLTSAQMMSAASFVGWGDDLDTVGGQAKAWRIYEGSTAPLLKAFLKTLTVTVGNTGKTYDGTATKALTSDDYTYSVTPEDGLLLGTGAGTYTASSANADTYTGTGETLTVTSDLHSGQQGYDITYVAGNFTIDKREITLVATPDHKTYGDANPASYGATLAGCTTLADTDSLSDVTGTMTRESGENAGTYDLALGTGAKASNYTITFTADNNAFTIDRAALSITANNVTRPQGDANPEFTATFDGFVNGEDSSVVTGLTLTTAATANSTGGTYEITPANAVSANYDIHYTPGVLTVEPSVVVVNGVRLEVARVGGQLLISNNYAVVVQEGRLTLVKLTGPISGSGIASVEKSMTATLTHIPIPRYITQSIADAPSYQGWVARITSLGGVKNPLVMTSFAEFLTLDKSTSVQ